MPMPANRQHVRCVRRPRSALAQHECARRPGHPPLSCPVESRRATAHCRVAAGTRGSSAPLIGEADSVAFAFPADPASGLVGGDLGKGVARAARRRRWRKHHRLPRCLRVTQGRHSALTHYWLQGTAHVSPGSVEFRERLGTRTWVMIRISQAAVVDADVQEREDARCFSPSAVTRFLSPAPPAKGQGLVPEPALRHREPPRPRRRSFDRVVVICC